MPFELWISRCYAFFKASNKRFRLLKSLLRAMGELKAETNPEAKAKTKFSVIR